MRDPLYLQLVQEPEIVQRVGSRSTAKLLKELKGYRRMIDSENMMQVGYKTDARNYVRELRI